ncbi:hypothetical protein H6G28_28305 [Nostoc sp. FACHB-190]|nr:hypothetical protein [Nostoc sp. FACHB-190]
MNNFYPGSIYDLVFLDLEFWPHYINGKTIQRIYGYTITRLMKSSKKQYIKIKFLEFEFEEEELIKEIMQDIYILKDKIFIGFNIKDSDLVTLRNRLITLSLPSNVEKINVFDFIKYSQSKEYRGLNGLFEYLGVKVNKTIDGSFFHKKAKKVFLKKQGWINILLNMFEYCLEDAAGYFGIVSAWSNKFPQITKDMIKSELINSSLNEEKLIVELINKNVEIFSSDILQPFSVQLVSNLKVAELEALITKIVQKVINEEIQKLKHEYLLTQITEYIQY